MNIDLKTKELAQLVKYLAGKKFLIIDPNKSIRLVTKKLLSSFKVEIIEAAPTDSIMVCEKLIKQNRPHFIICTKNIKDDSFQSLLSLHLETCPNRNNAGFILIADSEAFKHSAEYLDSELSSCIFPPFSIQNINTPILDFLLKLNNSEQEQLDLNNSLVPLFKRDYRKARITLEEYSKKYPKNPKGQFYLGKLAMTLEKPVKALDHFEQAIELKEDDYRCLNQALLSALELKEKTKAYNFSVKLIEYFDFSPDQLSCFIDISILNGKHEDIFTYENLIKNPKDLPQKQKQVLAAGLSQCSNYYHSISEPNKTLKALDLALEYAGTNFQLLKNICLIYVKLKNVDKAKEIISKLSGIVKMDQEFQILEFEVVSHYETPEYIVSEGLKNIRKKIKSPIIYANVIKASITMNRKSELIEDLIFEAKKDFPNDAASFNKFIQHFSK